MVPNKIFMASRIWICYSYHAPKPKDRIKVNDQTVKKPSIIDEWMHLMQRRIGCKKMDADKNSDTFMHEPVQSLLLRLFLDFNFNFIYSILTLKSNVVSISAFSALVFLARGLLSLDGWTHEGRLSIFLLFRVSSSYQFHENNTKTRDYKTDEQNEKWSSIKGDLE